MNQGKAMAIFRDINSPVFSDTEKGNAIYVVMNMETHNSLTKIQMLDVIRYLWGFVFEADECTREKGLIKEG